MWTHINIMKIRGLLIDELIIFKSWVQVVMPLWLQRRPFRLQPKEYLGKRFLILACDPGDPSGSLGDMAMLAGLMQSLRHDYVDAVFTIVGTRQHTIFVPGVGSVEVMPAWQGWSGAIAFDHLLRLHDAVFAIGADVMDGKYGGSLVCRLASYCNHALHLGKPATITGFSFNSTPRRAAVYALSKLHPSVRVNVRDRVSLGRFQSTVGIQANICSDVAFLLEPASEADSTTESWIKLAREKGLKLVGFNINSHAFSKVIEDIGIDLFIDKIAIELFKTIQISNIAYVLIPHDVKSSSGDISILNELEEKLRQMGVKNLTNIKPSNPANTKRLVGHLDFIVTARMHLAIAGLGMGTPVISIAYQDKFEGLYQHFNLGLDTLLYPERCVTEALSEKINGMIKHHVEISEKIKKEIPLIKKLAKSNIVFSIKKSHANLSFVYAFIFISNFSKEILYFI
jgi:polysaccharide pyruvyl transferase WcaK-like protein